MDFRTYYEAGSHVLHGQSPYPPISTDVLSRERSFVYPAPAALVAGSLALFPESLVLVIWQLVSYAAAVTAIIWCGERRLVALLLIAASPVLIQGLLVGTITGCLMLGAAAAWRYRDDRRGVAAVALVISLKLFLAPLLFFFFVTGRKRLGLEAIVTATVLTVVSWWLIAWEGFATYPQLLAKLGEAVGWRGFGLSNLLQTAGASRGVGDFAGYLAGVAILAVAWRLRRDEYAVFASSLVAAVVASPIVWMNYFGFILMAAALMRPRSVWTWLLIWLLWLVPHMQAVQNPWLLTAWFAVLFGLIAASSSQRTSPGSRTEDATGAAQKRPRRPVAALPQQGAS
jgi:Glycosyltransferase family 87